MSKLKSRRAARAASENSLYTDRKSMILTAAANVFLRKGLLATKLSDIADEANMDRASLYYYVGSKQDLFEEIFVLPVRNNVQKAAEIEARALPATEKLRMLIESLMASFDENHPFIYVFVQEDLRKIEQAADPRNERWLEIGKQLSKAYFEIVKRVVSKGITDGEIRTTLPPSLVAHSLVGMMNSSANWLRPNGIMDAHDIAAGMASMVIKGLEST